MPDGTRKTIVVPGYRIRADTRRGRFHVIPPEGDTLTVHNWASAYAACSGHRKGLLTARKLAEDLGNTETVEAIDEVLRRRFP